MWNSRGSNPLIRFILLYAAMYAAFGVASPFLPSFLSARGLPPEQLGLVLGAGTAVRLLTAPLAGRIGDLIQALRVVLVICTALAASATLGYLAAHEIWILLGVGLLHAASLAPITILADALALGSATPPAHSARRGFEYGWVRGTGSAAFIIGTLLSGQAVSAFGLDMIIWLQALLLGMAACAGILVPELVHHRTADVVRSPAGGVRVLLRIAQFRNLVIVAAMILGSHAMHDAFAVIRWSAAGISPATASLLWSESVAAEVLVFFVIGPALVGRLTPAGALATAALAGMLRWAVAAQTTDVMAHGAGAAAARHHLCAASSRLHAFDRPHRARRSRRHGAGDLWYGWHWSSQRVAHPCLRRAIRTLWCRRILGHGCAVLDCVTADSEAKRTRIRRESHSIIAAQRIIDNRQGCA